MNYPVAFSKWRQDEYLALMTVLGSDRYTCGDRVAEFENLFCETFGYEYAVMTNSGSSANLLIATAMLYGGFLKRGSTIIVPAIAWSTSYAPFIQLGMKLKVVDIDVDTLGYDIDALVKVKDADAILVVNMLGNPNEYDRIMEYAKANRLHVIEDSCEAMGAKYKNEIVGSFGIVGSFSMFFSHHISTTEGGVAVTSDKTLYEIMLSLRSHGWSKPSFRDFVYPGYNMRPTELSAAVGITQIKRFAEILDGYQRNALLFKSTVGTIPGIKIQKDCGASSWMGFYILAEELSVWKFDDLCRTLESLGIETRPIMCCFHKQPMKRFADYEITGSLTNAGKVYERGFYVGNTSENISNQILCLDSRLRTFITNLKGKEDDLHIHRVCPQRA